MLTLICAALLGQFTPVPLSDGGPLGLDDLGVAPDGRFVIPEAERGDVRLSAIAAGQPTRDARIAITGDGPHKIGSASVREGLVAAGDRTTKTIWVAPLEGTAEKSVTQPLAAGPDYVRIFGGEVWVTEPQKQQIEVFGLGRKPLTLKSIATLSVPGGPEALELDAAGGIAYTFSEDGGHLFGFDVAKHVQVRNWQLACSGKPKGLALSGDGIAFIGCSAGVALAISLKDGKELGRLPTGAGVDIIAFDRTSRRLYVPGAKAATLTIASVGPNGALTKLRELPSAVRGHCVAVSSGIVLVCDPPNGRLLRLDDK